MSPFYSDEKQVFPKYRKRLGLIGRGVSGTAPESRTLGGSINTITDSQYRVNVCKPFANIFQVLSPPKRYQRRPKPSKTGERFLSLG